MITEEALIDLKKLLTAWNINPDDWYVTGEAAMVLSKYPVSFRDQQMDVLVCRSAWPWNKPDEEVSLFPPKDSSQETELKEYIQKHSITPDFHPLPHVGLRAEDRFDHTYIYSPDSGVRVLSPWAGIYHRKCIIEFYEKNFDVGLNAFDKNKFIRWKKFVEETKSFANERSDQKTIDTCDLVLPVIDRAIAFFDKSTNILNSETTLLKGIVACSGKVTGEVKLWDEQADCADKIVVLKAALPYQFAKLSNAKGLITDEGGLLGHAAVISREYKIPTIIGTLHATIKLKDGDMIELDANTGTVKKIS